jgi:hypothetical protein
MSPRNASVVTVRSELSRASRACCGPASTWRNHSLVESATNMNTTTNASTFKREPARSI